MTPTLFSAAFDSLSEGDRFTTRGRTVTESDVVAFAGLTGDYHPQHTDAEFSAQSPFGERIAHGLLVVSLAAGLVSFDPGRVVALRQVAQATFKRPVHFGDTLHVEGRIAELSDAAEDAGLVTFAWNVVNQDDRVVCRARVDVLWRRDGESETAADLTEANEFVPIPL
jgi:3-hydroxybutyryl-CoA dehydratase